MGSDAQQYGGGSSTTVGNNWMNLLNSGLSSGSGGQFSNPSNPQQIGGYAQGGNPAALGGGRPINGLPTNPNGSNPSGGMGTPGASPTSAMNQSGGMAGYINNTLNGNPGQATYNDPNNPRPQGFTPTTIGNQNAPQYQFNAAQNPGASNTFNQSQSGQLGIAGGLGWYGGQNMGINPGMMGAPGAPGVGGFSSQGILGDRSNVASAITNAAQLQDQQALAAQNARFTQSGGMSGGTPAAYATAQTQTQSNIGLANSLAQSDINYRNLDLGGYQAQNQAQQQQFGTQANIFGTQQGALGQYNQLGLGYGNLGLSSANSAANIYGNVAGQQAGQQALGFNYNQLAQQGQGQNNQLNLNSALGFGQLNNQAQQYNNQNAYNSANLAQNAYGQQGQLDLATQAQQYNQQQNLINQLFGSYNNAANRGIPPAGTSFQPDTGQNIINAIPGLVSAGVSIAPLLNQGQQSIPGSTQYQYTAPPQIDPNSYMNQQSPTYG